MATATFTGPGVSHFGKLYKILHKNPVTLFHRIAFVLVAYFHGVSASKALYITARHFVPNNEILADYFPWETIISTRNPTATAIKMIPTIKKVLFFCSGAGNEHVDGFGLLLGRLDLLNFKIVHHRLLGFGSFYLGNTYGGALYYLWLLGS